jgi:CheY-like chemotaxis protein
VFEDLLDMSRIVAGKVRLDMQRVSPAAVIEAAAESVRPSADAKGVHLGLRLDRLAGPVTGDPARLQQVVWNLLANAIKFTPRGGRVEVRLARVSSHVEITIADTGAGIAPDFLPHVFERFRQADASTTRQHGGLGVGLSIVKQLAEMHGGSVRAESPGPGGGATFTVELPFRAMEEAGGDAREDRDDAGGDSGRARRHPQTTPSSDGRASACNGVELDGVRVLVVDDEPDARVLIKRFLERCGAKVVTAASAAEALQVLGQLDPHVIVSDIGMPLQDGYEFMTQARRQGVTAPALALTAFARAEDRLRSLYAGYQLHLSKPVEPAELVAAVAGMAGRPGTNG